MIEKLLEALLETLALTFIPLIFAIVFGTILGTIIFVLASDSFIKRKNVVFKILHSMGEFLINLFRSIPYTILLVWCIPLAKAITGTMLGVKAAIPSLVISATPFFARMVIIGFTEVDKGTIEAAKAMGCSNFQIIVKVLIPESLPALVSSISVTAINLVSYSTMAGAIGSGGLGFTAYNEGFLRNKTEILLIATILILLIVFIIQMLGNSLSKAVDRR